MCEQKLGQEQIPPTSGRKILWIIGSEEENQIGKYKIAKPSETFKTGEKQHEQ